MPTEVTEVMKFLQRAPSNRLSQTGPPAEGDRVVTANFYYCKNCFEQTIRSFDVCNQSEAQPKKTKRTENLGKVIPLTSWTKRTDLPST